MFSEQADPRRHIRRSRGSHGDRARRAQACKEGGGALVDGVLEQRALEQRVPEEGLLEQHALEQGVLEQHALEQHALNQGAPEQGELEGAPEGLRKRRR